MLNRDNEELPCYAELIGRCNNTPCRFSYDKKLLYKAWKDRMEELHLLKYKISSGRVVFHNNPHTLKRDKPLRAINNVDEKQVSTANKQKPLLTGIN